MCKTNVRWKNSAMKNQGVSQAIFVVSGGGFWGSRKPGRDHVGPSGGTYFFFLLQNSRDVDLGMIQAEITHQGKDSRWDGETACLLLPCPLAVGSGEAQVLSICGHKDGEGITG